MSERWLVRLTQAPGHRPQLMVLPWEKELACLVVDGMKQWDVLAETPWKAAEVASAKAAAAQSKEPDPLWSIFLGQDGELAEHPYLAGNQEGRERRCESCAGEWHEYVRAPNPEQATSVARGHQMVAGATARTAKESDQLWSVWLTSEGQAGDVALANDQAGAERVCDACETRHVYVRATYPTVARKLAEGRYKEHLNNQSLNACSNEKHRDPGYSVPTPCQPEQFNSTSAHGVRAKIPRSAESFVQCFSTAGKKLAARLYRASLQRFFSGRAGKSDS